MSLFMLSVSKTYSNSSKRYKTRYKPKNIRYAYFVDENGKMVRKKLTKFEYFISKHFKTKWKRRKFICEECGDSFTGLIKKEGDQVDCPNC